MGDIVIRAAYDDVRRFRYRQKVGSYGSVMIRSPPDSIKNDACPNQVMFIEYLPQL